jgi:hypothetical protein
VDNCHPYDTRYGVADSVFITIEGGAYNFSMGGSEDKKARGRLPHGGRGHWVPVAQVQLTLAYELFVTDSIQLA